MRRADFHSAIYGTARPRGDDRRSTTAAAVFGSCAGGREFDGVRQGSLPAVQLVHGTNHAGQRARKSWPASSPSRLSIFRIKFNRYGENRVSGRDRDRYRYSYASRRWTPMPNRNNLFFVHPQTSSQLLATKQVRCSDAYPHHHLEAFMQLVLERPVSAAWQARPSEMQPDRSIRREARGRVPVLSRLRAICAERP